MNIDPSQRILHTNVCFPGPIEKGASDGQGTYANDLVKALRQGLTSRSRANTLGSKIKSKGKRRKGDADASKTSLADTSSKPTASRKQGSNWGLLEPLHPLLGPIVDPIMTLVNSNVIIGFLILTLLITWYRSPAPPSKRLAAFPGMPTPERMAAYEEIWRAEESELWDWLEERVGMERLAYPARGEKPVEKRKKREKGQTRRTQSQGVRARLAEEKMGRREVAEAIRVTEEKLKVLKAVVEKRGKGGEKRAERHEYEGGDGSEGGETVEDEGYVSDGNEGDEKINVS